LHTLNHAWKFLALLKVKEIRMEDFAPFISKFFGGGMPPYPPYNVCTCSPHFEPMALNFPPFLYKFDRLIPDQLLCCFSFFCFMRHISSYRGMIKL
jgi:hypothetical protein